MAGFPWPCHFLHNRQRASAGSTSTHHALFSRPRRPPTRRFLRSCLLYRRFLWFSHLVAPWLFQWFFSKSPRSFRVRYPLGLHHPCINSSSSSPTDLHGGGKASSSIESDRDFILNALSAMEREDELVNLRVRLESPLLSDRSSSATIIPAVVSIFRISMPS